MEHLWHNEKKKFVKTIYKKQHIVFIIQMEISSKTKKRICVLNDSTVTAVIVRGAFNTVTVGGQVPVKTIFGKT